MNDPYEFDRCLYCDALTLDDEHICFLCRERYYCCGFNFIDWIYCFFR